MTKWTNELINSPTSETPASNWPKPELFSKNIPQEELEVDGDMEEGQAEIENE
jgi:hypothetical protein